MMLVDINAYLGHWPFRPLRNNTAAELAALMARKGVDKAVVSSLDAILYKNSQAGNEKLATSIAAYPDLFIPFATINPTYAAWEEDIVRCHKELGMKGLRIYPAYHGYALQDKVCADLMAVAAERDLPVAIPLRMEDRRQRHWMDTAQDITPGEIAEFISGYPKVKFMILNGIGDTVDWATLRDAHVLIDISRLSNLRLRAPPRDASIPGLIDALGADKLAFGTGMPIKYPDPALLKVEILETTESIVERIRWQNAAEMLRLT